MDQLIPVQGQLWALQYTRDLDDLSTWVRDKVM